MESYLITTNCNMKINKTLLSQLAQAFQDNKNLILAMQSNATVDPIDIYKKGKKILIKKKNRGKFTDYCGGKVTQACIQKGKNSPNPKTRKRADFAAIVRTWKH